jgi:hypothetical protein
MFFRPLQAWRWRFICLQKSSSEKSTESEETNNWISRCHHECMDTSHCCFKRPFHCTFPSVEAIAFMNVTHSQSFCNSASAPIDSQRKTSLPSEKQPFLVAVPTDVTANVPFVSAFFSFRVDRREALYQYDKGRHPLQSNVISSNLIECHLLSSHLMAYHLIWSNPSSSHLI